MGEPSKTQDGPIGPDFLCIGMGKAGTGWLYSLLNYHPDFWMPPVKELHYLNRSEPKMSSRVEAYLSRPRVDDEIPRREGRKAFGKKEIEFLELVQANKSKPMDLDFYASMFRYKDNLLSGDVTPSYCSMPEELIAKIMARFPKLKIILLIRDPVSRAWSHFAMRHRNGKLRKFDPLDPEEFAAQLDESRAVRTGQPAAFAKIWRNQVPPDQFRYYFFDDLVADPDGLIRQILEFLGGDPNKKSTLDAAENRKARPSLKITEEIQAILVKKFTPELIESAQVFGGHATQWASKYGVELP